MNKSSLGFYFDLYYNDLITLTQVLEEESKKYMGMKAAEEFTYTIKEYLQRIHSDVNNLYNEAQIELEERLYG
jgi:hypothetical protein